MRAGLRVLTMAVALTTASSIASAYYNWVFFSSRTGPFTPIPAKFDLNALPNNTVSYFISDQQPGPLMPGDTFTAIVSQIQAAANAWNQVATSSIRLSFGGISTIGIPQSTPGIDVIFDDDLPPGLLAQTRPTVPADLSFVSRNPAFVPISRSTVQFRHDLTNPYGQASYYDSVYLTMVHEFGHALGLQHTLTSAVMSTAITRATTKAAPLAPDDAAGISVLYPAQGFFQSTGVISGSVSLGGTGLNLASVVALSPGGVAISGMSNPDGTYQIAGLPPGQYYVYAHPLPVAQQGEAYPANIYPPQDPQSTPFPADTGFDTEFYPGTRDWTQAALVTVAPGAVSGGVNFSMQPRAAQAIPYVLTYGYEGQAQVPSPPLLGGASSPAPMVFYAPGTTSGDQLAPGLSISVIGGPAQVVPGSLKYYDGTGGYGYFYMGTNVVTSATPMALAVNLPNDLYVLPAALTVVPNAPPAISSVTGTTDAQGNTTVTVAGTNLGASTRFVFDGAPATVLAANSDGSLTVAAPPALPSYQAKVEALSGDGQTSSQALDNTQPPTTPPVFTYPNSATPSISANSGLLLPGADAMVDIIGVNTNFNSQTVAGFGSSDIVVKRIWVLNAQRLLMNVSVSPAAQPGPVELTINSGLQLLTLTTVLQVQTANPKQQSLRVPVVNYWTGLAGIPAGGSAIINTSGLPQSLAGWTVKVDNQVASFFPLSNQIDVQVPATNIPLGPAIVQLISPNGDLIPPVVMQIDAPPPVIVAASNATGAGIDATHPVRPGDTVMLSVSGLTDASVTSVSPSSIDIDVAGVHQIPSAIQPGSGPGNYLLNFTLNPNVPFGPQQWVTVGLGTRVSDRNGFALSILPK